MRILIVCLGNICRSPIAEGLLRDKAKKHGLNWTVASAGTGNYHTGEPPHHFSQKICRANGIDISDLRASKFTRDDFARYDKIYAMAEDVYKEIRHIAGADADMSKVDFFLNELPETPMLWHGNKNESVPDPYYGTEEGYKTVYELINITCDAIIARYK
jgi:protein-tyrosine phosphatase